jgi:hypothetical protein
MTSAIPLLPAVQAAHKAGVGVLGEHSDSEQPVQGSEQVGESLAGHGSDGRDQGGKAEGFAVFFESPDSDRSRKLERTLGKCI